jgi:hypothetical protein
VTDREPDPPTATGRVVGFWIFVAVLQGLAVRGYAKPTGWELPYGSDLGGWNMYGEAVDSTLEAFLVGPDSRESVWVLPHIASDSLGRACHPARSGAATPRVLQCRGPLRTRERIALPALAVASPRA